MATAQLSTLLKVGIGSPTTRIAAASVTNSSNTYNFTAPANAPVRININLTTTTTGNPLSVDGVLLAIVGGTPVVFTYYLGAGQSTVIIVSAGSGITTAAFISANKVD